MAEEASRVKGRFLSTVGHELRTPLSVVVGLSDLVLREAHEAGSLPPTLLDDLERLGQSAAHLGRLLNDVLDLTSGETGRLRLRLEEVELGHALEGVVAVAQEMAEASGLAFDLRMPLPGPRVMADATRLRQVVLNLVSNAVRFTPSGHVTVEASSDGGRAVVTVTDTGPGIDPAELPELLSGVGRVPGTPAHGRAGLGIGLAIASDLVALHGGRLDVRSPVEDGHGSSFAVSLPLLEAEGAVDPRRDETARGGDAARGRSAVRIPDAASGDTIPNVLIVDDDPDVLEVHARLVIDARARPLRASDSVEALALLAREPIDLIMLDLRMAGEDGFGFLEILRERPADRDVPVIVVTGQDLDDEDVERLDDGVVAIVGKGLFDVTELRARVEAALAGRRRVGSSARRVVRRAAGFIDRHHAEALSREDIARAVAMSPDYLTDCFRQELGLTPMTYLLRCRIRHARELLERTDQQITAIALDVGFAGTSQFSRTFHREVGVSPRAYRLASAR
jgi:AraC-like DNA-binding protein